MSPAKSLFPIFLWLMRIAVVFVVYTHFFGLIKTFDTSSLAFFIAAAYGLFALLLFFGGFAKNHTLTIISGLVIAGLSVYKMVDMGFALNNSVSFYALLTATGLLFVGSGNKK